MAKEFKVFFSWQSDLTSNKTRRFIEECIDDVKEQLKSRVEVIPDQATRNKYGTPDIMETIFDKISSCDLFIADLSIVGNYDVSDGEDETVKKHLPNPNVLLELGYAAGTITWDRCICLANTDFGIIDKLPFDLNHRRITPFCYKDGGRKAEKERITSIIQETILSPLNA